MIVAGQCQPNVTGAAAYAYNSRYQAYPGTPDQYDTGYAYWVYPGGGAQNVGNHSGNSGLFFNATPALAGDGLVLVEW